MSALLFPGQGSQIVGMGTEFFKNYSQVKEIFKRADEKLEMKSAAIPKGLSIDDAIKTFKMSFDRDPKNLKEVIDFFKNRRLNKALPKNLKTIV